MHSGSPGAALLKRRLALQLPASMRLTHGPKQFGCFLKAAHVAVIQVAALGGLYNSSVYITMCCFN